MKCHIYTPPHPLTLHTISYPHSTHHLIPSLYTPSHTLTLHTISYPHSTHHLIPSLYTPSHTLTLHTISYPHSTYHLIPSLYTPSHTLTLHTISYPHTTHHPIPSHYTPSYPHTTHHPIPSFYTPSYPPNYTLPSITHCTYLAFGCLYIKELFLTPNTPHTLRGTVSSLLPLLLPILAHRVGVASKVPHVSITILLKPQVSPP